MSSDVISAKKVAAHLPLPKERSRIDGFLTGTRGKYREGKEKGVVAP